MARALLCSALFGCAIVLPASAAVAQEADPDPDGWNAPKVLELVEGGRQARAGVLTEGDLETYQALTEGHVYFFLDPDVGERLLIRIDQVAVELRWAAPDRFQQRIVGERSETRLPVQDFRYYLDRLTLVQHGFGDEIRVGSGMDVSGVPHPLAHPPGGDPSRSPYDYRLADSLTLTLPGRPAPLRLYEVEVRPRDPGARGILGSITLDRGSHQIVRMAFTFTPASYVDPRTDRISVELDYGLWQDRYWLPNLQRIEVRRELPEFDLGVGTIIRAVLRTGGYELNVPLSESFRSEPPITAFPPEARRNYPFRQGLYDGLARDGLAQVRVDVDPRRLREEGLELLSARPPSGLRPFRLHLPNVSSGVRFSRTEGLFVGMGGSFRPGWGTRIRGHGGSALAAREPQGELNLQTTVRPGWILEAGARLNIPSDLGLRPGIDPLLSSLGAALRGEDYRDPYRSTGGDARLTFGTEGGLDASLSLGGERVRNAQLHVSEAPLDREREFRAVRTVAEGDFLTAGGLLRRPFGWPLGGRGWGEAGVQLLAGAPGTGVGLSASTAGQWGPLSGTRALEVQTTAWSWAGDPLPQGHKLLGGRGTLPGFPYRGFVGRHAIVSSLVGSADVMGPHLRLRGGLHAGWADGGAAGVSEAWNATGTAGIRASASLGAGLGWDLVRLELARGLNGGEWQILLSVDPRWWGRL